MPGDNPSKERKKVEGVEIGDNAFVGARSLLLPGVRIGRDAVVGAGSVVRGEVLAGAIVVGNPASVVSSVYPGAVEPLPDTGRLH